MKFSMIALGMSLALFSGSVTAQPAQQNVGLLGQALDRCMTTVADRESRAESDDEIIFEFAVATCGELKDPLFAAIRAQFPSEQAEEAISMIDAQAKPNFLNMLLRIRSDRQR